MIPAGVPTPPSPNPRDSSAVPRNSPTFWSHCGGAGNRTRAGRLPAPPRASRRVCGNVPGVFPMVAVAVLHVVNQRRVSVDLPKHPNSQASGRGSQSPTASGIPYILNRARRYGLAPLEGRSAILAARPVRRWARPDGGLHAQEKWRCRNDPDHQRAASEPRRARGVRRARLTTRTFLRHLANS